MTEKRKRFPSLLPLPAYGWAALAGAFALNTLVYGGARLIAGSWPHCIMETALDRAIPFLPWTVAVYFGCYLFWGVNYILVIRQGWERTCRLFAADFLAKAVCFAFFLLLPTTVSRPSAEGAGLWLGLTRFLYAVDAPDNLFPSIHCLVSWLCWAGVRGRRDVPAWYRVFSLLLALAVCVSTLTTKQHVLADVFMGVALAELCWLLAGRGGLSRLYGRGLRALCGRRRPAEEAADEK